MKKKLVLLIAVLALSAALSLQTAGAALEGKIKIVGSTSMQPLAEELARAFMAANPGVIIVVSGGSSLVGVKAAQTGSDDIGACARELKPEEKPAAMVSTAIARDGIAVVVNSANKVNALTMDQLGKIFSGRIKNWKDVGGADANISVIGREADGETASGTRVAFEEIVLKPKNLKVTSSLILQGSTGMVRQIVSVASASVGYITMGSVDASLKALKIDGIEPNKTTVQNKTYKLTRPFLFLTKGAPKGATKAFIDFVLSPAGQAIVANKFAPVGMTK